MDNYDSLLRIADLVARMELGTITAQEQRELDAWLAESEDNGALYRNIAGTESLGRYCENAAQTDFGKAMNSVGRKIRRSARRRNVGRAGMAAAMLAGVVFAAWMLVVERPGRSESAILAGTAQAVLVMPGGHRIELGEEEQETGWQKYAAPERTVVDESVQMVRVEVPRGGEYRLTLDDGSRVWLNSGTWIEYPLNFVGGVRRFTLSGEAFFDVARDSLRPFEIMASDGVAITVLGTRFNVRSYDDAEDVRVTLIEGAVAVSHDGDSLELRPDQQVLFDRLSRDMSICEVPNAADFASWCDGKFMLGDMNIEDVMEQFERWYDITVEYEYRHAHHFGGAISRNMELAGALDLLRATGAVDFRVDGRTVTVTAPRSK